MANVQAGVDGLLRAQAQAEASSMGLDLASAVRMSPLAKFLLTKLLAKYAYVV
jgi:antitoxin component of RelBE/YafQ-DinJ toxin-antitoxin module